MEPLSMIMLSLWLLFSTVPAKVLTTDVAAYYQKVGGEMGQVLSAAWRDPLKCDPARHRPAETLKGGRVQLSVPYVPLALDFTVPDAEYCGPR